MDKQMPQLGDDKQPPLVIDEEGEAGTVDVTSGIDDAHSERPNFGLVTPCLTDTQKSAPRKKTYV